MRVCITEGCNETLDPALSKKFMFCPTCKAARKKATNANRYNGPNSASARTSGVTLEPKVRDYAKMKHYGPEMHEDYPQVEQLKPWVKRMVPKLMTEAEQREIDSEARRRDDERQGFKIAKCRKVPPEEWASMNITPISEIPWTGGPLYGLGQLDF